MKRLLVASALLTFTALSPGARAEPDRLAPPVTVRIEAEGVRWSVEGIGSGTGAATLQVPQGTHKVRIGEVTEQILIDRPSTLQHRPAIPALRTAGAAGFFTGIFVAGLSLLAASGLCDSTTTDIFGRVVHRSCPRWDEPTSRAFIIAAGVGLTLTVSGGIVFFASGETMRVRDLEPTKTAARAPSRARIGVAPWLSGRDGGAVMTWAF